VYVEVPVIRRGSSLRLTWAPIIFTAMVVLSSVVWGA
jgi:hypothetical protein